MTQKKTQMGLFLNDVIVPRDNAVLAKEILFMSDKKHTSVSGLNSDCNQKSCIAAAIWGYFLWFWTSKQTAACCKSQIKQYKPSHRRRALTCQHEAEQQIKGLIFCIVVEHFLTWLLRSCSFSLCLFNHANLIIITLFSTKKKLIISIHVKPHLFLRADSMQKESKIKFLKSFTSLFSFFCEE